jgi:hypothetical protein
VVSVAVVVVDRRRDEGERIAVRSRGKHEMMNVTLVAYSWRRGRKGKKFGIEGIWGEWWRK